MSQLTIPRAHALGGEQAWIDVGLRYLLTAVCAGSAGVHAALIRPHFLESGLLGWAFTGSAIALALAALAVRQPRRFPWRQPLYDVGIQVRNRGGWHAWRGREILLPAASWPAVADSAPTPQQFAEARDLLAALQEEIERRLTSWQRQVFVAIALNNVPIDVLAERLHTTRGALYKTLHDARRTLRAALADRGMGTMGRLP
jgi:DNA-directed RNA polymerase specialized sigma24 family protein